MTIRIRRREFLKQGGLIGAGFWVAGSAGRVHSKSPNEKLNIGIIGAGGRGASNLNDLSGENIVALCDVNEQNLGKAAEKHPKARKYIDFRKLFDEARDLDAMVVSTTEHTHAFAVLPALQLGKHVYCEKPLCHTVWETRRVIEEARKAKVATQMGTQIHAKENYRRVVELVQAGVVGPIRECHVWVERGGPSWGDGERPAKADPVPPYLHWDLWLGPAPARPFNHVYFPGPKWYKWWDFGGGTMPDLGSHFNDLPFWALKLKHPLTVEAEGPPVSPETAPAACTAYWEFPARDKMPPVKLTWHQGGRKPDLAAEGRIPAWGSGILFVGDKGMILADYSRFVLLPESEFSGFKPPPPTIPRSLGHHAEWIHACKTGEPTTCNFEYSGALTESNLLGNVAYRVGKKLEWDPVQLKATNCPEADKYIHKEFRKGWVL